LRLEEDRRCGKRLQKGNSTCYVFVNVRFNGVLKFARTAKIREFDTFSKCKSRGVGYHVSHGSQLKMSSRTGVTYVKLKDTRHSLGTNGEKEYKILKFSAYYETTKFTGDQTDLLGKLK